MTNKKISSTIKNSNELYSTSKCYYSCHYTINTDFTIYYFLNAASKFDYHKDWIFLVISKLDIIDNWVDDYDILINNFLNYNLYILKLFI
jgi:hypothetical protein